MEVRQSTATVVLFGPILNSAYLITDDAMSGSDFNLMDSAGTVTNLSGQTATSLGGGYYKLTLSADVLGTLGVAFIYLVKTNYESGWLDLQVRPASWFDSVCVGTGAVPTTDAGSGDVLVNHNYGGTDALRISNGSSGIDAANITAYLTADYAAGTYTVRGVAVTGTDGRWVSPMMLNAGVYTLVVKVAGYQPYTVEVTVV